MTRGPMMVSVVQASSGADVFEALSESLKVFR